MVKYRSSLLLLIAMLFLLSGCDLPIVINQKGIIGEHEIHLVRDAILLMLIVVVPVIIMTFVFAWKFRATNKRAHYAPNFHHSNVIEAAVWFIPIMIILVLATITWRTTHELDPYKPVVVLGAKPITIQVVALDWKWLFIYPEQNIASVNFVEFPANTPVNFKITADAPMNAFQIPQLGGQIYAMAGMQTKIHLVANEPGDYFGRSVNYSGRGFSGMQFVARATSIADFNKWVDQVKHSGKALNVDEYKKLAQPSEDDPVRVFAWVETRLFDKIIMKFMMPGMEDLNMDPADMKHMSM
ncbi:MAG: ubiquinol oxidase subunit II [Burkholderiales bacterium]|nr:ubiquinol oxidase subunit II [Burkholderiales bacterium]